MTKNCIITVCIGDYYKKISKYTHPTIKKYAEKIGADFIVIDEENSNIVSQKWRKFEIYNYLNKYQRIIYLDTDLIVREDTPDLFEIVPETAIGIFNEGKWVSRVKFIEEAQEFYGEKLKKITSAFYNTGVMVISRMHKQIFKLPIQYYKARDEQSYINLRILKDKYTVFSLDYRFNRMEFLDTKIGISRLDSFIIHYANAPKEIIFTLLKDDLNDWKKMSPTFERLKRNIVVSVSAGMGDQLASEPAIRYLIEHVFKDDLITITTHHPRLFAHFTRFKNVRVMDYNSYIGNKDATLVLHTCPDDDNNDHGLSHVFFHPCDYASISLFKMSIPNKDKTIELALFLEDLNDVLSITGIDEDLTNLILIHPGKWWPSKTFPVDWWQEIIDTLAAQGHKLGLIGKTIDKDQGYLPVTCPENCYDFRDITSLGSLIQLISAAKITLTNDSSPIHIAGAFNNWIVTIPTAKHQDDILPYRNGVQDYKTSALCKKLLVGELNLLWMNESSDSIDKIPEGDTILDYIPDTQTVINEVNRICDIIKIEKQNEIN